MDFELNDDQVAFADAAKAFAQSELEPNAAKWDEEKFSQWRCCAARVKWAFVACIHPKT